MSTNNYTEVPDVDESVSAEAVDDNSRFTVPKKLLFESSLWVACPEAK